MRRITIRQELYFQSIPSIFAAEMLKIEENGEKKAENSLPGYKFDTNVNGTQTTLTSKSAMAKFPMNLFVSVRICGDFVTTINTATFPITPIMLIIL